MILFRASLSLLAGVVVAAVGLAAVWPVVLIGGAGLSLAWLRAGRKLLALSAALLLPLVLLGIARYEAARPPAHPGGVASLNDSGEPVTLRGLVVDEPSTGETSQRFTLQAESYLAPDGWQETSARVIVSTTQYPVYRHGDLLELTVELQTPPVFDTFDYREYLARRGVVSQALFPSIDLLDSGGGAAWKRTLLSFRGHFAEALRQALPEPESALARGILLGQRAGIPESVTDDFNRAGIAHLVAISGQNMAIVAGAVVASLAWLIGRRSATAVAMAVVIVYAVFVGGSPPVVRAAVMALVMLGATLAGRPNSAFSAVVLVAAVLVTARPLLINDVGFQLSVAATLGIVVAGQRVEQWLEPWFRWLPPRLAAFLAENLAITTVASIAVLPVIAASFGRVSLVALPANLLAAPVFVWSLFGSFVVAVAGAIDLTLGRLLADVALLPLGILVGLADRAADVPLASLDVLGVTLPLAAAAYGAIALAWSWLRRFQPTELERGRVRRVSTPALAAIAVSVLAVFVWLGALRPGDGRLQVTVLDVGQGDAILIESPSGYRVLIDGGPSASWLANALGRVLPAHDRRIDLIVLTHAQDDHVTGLVEALQRYEVGAALAGPLGNETGAYTAWRAELAAHGVPVLDATAGSWFGLGDGVRLEVLAPPAEPLSGTDDDLNNNAVVLRLVYGKVSFLLTGDLSADGEAALLDSPAVVRSTVLKVGHHGSDGATTAAFVEAVQPSLAVVSAGNDNRFGHPSPTTRRRLAGVPLLRTDQNGDVSLRTDGRSLWVTFARGDYSLVEAALR